MDLYVRATIVIVLFGVVKTQTGKYLSNIKILDCFVLLRKFFENTAKYYIIKFLDGCCKTLEISTTEKGNNFHNNWYNDNANVLGIFVQRGFFEGHHIYKLINGSGAYLRFLDDKNWKVNMA